MSACLSASMSVSALLYVYVLCLSVCLLYVRLHTACLRACSVVLTLGEKGRLKKNPVDS